MATYQYATKSGGLSNTFEAADEKSALSMIGSFGDAAANTGVMTVNSPTPTLTPLSSPTTPPTTTKTPTLPTPTATSTETAYVSSLTGARDQLRTQVEETYKTQKADVDKKLEAAEIKQQGYLSQMDPTTRPTYDQEVRIMQNELDAAETASKSIEGNFLEKQRLVGELEKLLTQGNEAIERQRQTPVAQRVLNSRVNNTIQDVAARTGVIEAVLNAREGQINLAYEIMGEAKKTVAANWKDITDYYSTLLSYNEQKIISLDKESKAIAEKQVKMVEDELKKLDESVDYIQGLMISPETAQFIADAGVKLTDSIDEINTKMANQARIKEATDMTNELVLKGYTPLGYNAPGSVAIEVGGKTLYFKAPPEKKTGTGTGSDKVLGILDIQRYQDLYPDAGVEAGDTEATANAKVAALNSPEGQLRSSFTLFRDNEITYEEVVKEINNDTTITDKTSAIAIANEVYGVEGGSEPAAQSKIEQDIAPMVEGGILTKGDMREALRNRGYTDAEIANSSVGSLIDKIGQFLFGK